MQLKELITYTDRLLAVNNFKDYCPNGLQVAGRDEVQTVIGGVTACQALLDAAVERNADAVLAHHGWFWKGEDPRIIGMKQRRLATLLRHDISLIAYHLPLDAHPELGNNAQLAQRLGLSVTQRVGSGILENLVLLGDVLEPVSGAAFVERISQQLQRTPLYIAGHAPQIRRLAWCSGAAPEGIEEALAAGVDGFLTGEASEPSVHIARENSLHFFAAGHHATERYGVQALGAHLAAHFGMRFEFVDIDNPV